MLIVVKLMSLDLDFDLSDAELKRYSRQILLDDWDIAAQEKLKMSNILIIGCGGIGCLTAELLARAGVGKISLVDPDVVDESNLQRQVAFIPSDVGFYKADILAKRLQCINPCIEVLAYSCAFGSDNAQQLLAEQDLVLDGSDNFATRYVVNQHCYDRAIPLLTAAAQGLEGKILFIDQSPCYMCVFPEAAQDSESCQERGVLATTPNIIASLQAHHALLYLGLGQYPLKHKLLLWQGQNLSSRILNVNFNPQCPVCRAQTYVS